MQVVRIKRSRHLDMSAEELHTVESSSLYYESWKYTNCLDTSSRRVMYGLRMILWL